MPAFGQVDQRLESKLVELYRLHKERSAKVDWSYHEFLPISRRLKLRDVRPDGSDDLARADLFERVARFANRTARHAMVPRVDVFMLPMGTTGEEAAKQLRTHQYSRVVLTKEKSVDEVAGYLYAKDFLLDPNNERLPSLETLKRELLFVPETQSLLDVLRDMQKSQAFFRALGLEFNPQFSNDKGACLMIAARSIRLPRFRLRRRMGAM